MVKIKACSIHRKKISSEGKNSYPIFTTTASTSQYIKFEIIICKHSRNKCCLLHITKVQKGYHFWISTEFHCSSFPNVVDSLICKSGGAFLQNTHQLKTNVSVLIIGNLWTITVEVGIFFTQIFYIHSRPG